MGAIAELFRAFAPEYLQRFPLLPAQHRKAIEAILACRSGELGSTVYRCTDSDCGLLVATMDEVDGREDFQNVLTMVV